MHQKAGVAFLLGMRQIIMDAVAIEGEGREAEQQKGRCVHRPFGGDALFALGPRRGRSSRLAEHQILPLTNGEAILVRDLMHDRDEAEFAELPRLKRMSAMRRGAADLGTSAQRPEVSMTPPAHMRRGSAMGGRNMPLRSAPSGPVSPLRGIGGRKAEMQAGRAAHTAPLEQEG